LQNIDDTVKTKTFLCFCQLSRNYAENGGHNNSPAQTLKDSITNYKKRRAMKPAKKNSKKKITLELTDNFASAPIKRPIRLSSRYLRISFFNFELYKKDGKNSLFLDKNPNYSEYSVGRFSYGQPVVLSYGSHCQVKIGSFCSIARGVTILTGGEHRPDWVTTYPFNILFKKFHNFGDSKPESDVIIGNDVWIGFNVTILPGVKINDGAVVGACSVVTKDVPPYAIVAGSPARLIRKRFDQETIDGLLRIKWWNWDIQRIEDNMSILLSNNVKEFVQKNISTKSFESQKEDE
jgi:acetyltransferase-like isoleucine patch superfamily enzyme